MTPKEKAAELIDKFTYWNTSEAEREGIKSALIAVDEIIEECRLERDWYWEEVKDEILKM